MSEMKTIERANFTCVHAGPARDWTQFRMDPPEVPFAVRGKRFLGKALGATGMEMSLNVVLPGKGIPFLHRHQDNDEVYVVVGGRGQFLIDGECVEVEEGSVIRVGPEGARAWRNTSEAPLVFLCIQYRADSKILGGTQDGRKVDEPLTWPEKRTV